MVSRWISITVMNSSSEALHIDLLSFLFCFVLSSCHVLLFVTATWRCFGFSLGSAPVLSLVYYPDVRTCSVLDPLMSTLTVYTLLFLVSVFPGFDPHMFLCSEYGLYMFNCNTDNDTGFVDCP